MFAKAVKKAESPAAPAEAKANSTSDAELPTGTGPDRLTIPPNELMSDLEFLHLLGEVSWLMTRSAKHQHVFMADLGWLVLPPLALKQARIFRTKPQAVPTQDGGQPPAAPLIGQPVAFISWALVSEEVDARLKAGIGRLQPAEWRCGLHPWIIDVLAPFGSADKILPGLIEEIFGGKPVSVFGMRPAAAAASAPPTPSEK